MHLPNVLFVNHAAEIGGAEKSLQQLVSNLPNRSVVTLLSAGPFLDVLRNDGIDVDVVPNADGLTALGSKTTVLKRIASLVHLPGVVMSLARKAAAADVVYVNTKKALLPSLLAAWVAGRPAIWHQRDAMETTVAGISRTSLSERLLIRLVNRRVARVICVSRATAETFISAGGREDLPVVVHNGIDPGPFMQDFDRTAIRRTLGLPDSVVVVGSFGRLVDWKGQKTLIHVLSNMRETHLVIVGSSPPEDNSYESLLHDLADRLGVSERVHWLGHRSDIPSVMHAVDVIVHTSITHEPFGRVIVEAMLSRRPIIGTAVGGVPEIIQDGVNGYLVEPGDPGALALILRSLMSDRNKYREVSEAGYRKASSCFTLDRVVHSVCREIAAVTSSNQSYG